MDKKTLRTNILGNLDDLGITYFTAIDVDDAIKDGYNRYATLTGCITKSVDLPMVLNEPYLPVKGYIADYLFPVAIWNGNTHCWLHGRNVRYFDSLRWDWELWIGEPQMFSPIDFVRLAIVPHQAVAFGDFTLIYQAQPPSSLPDDFVFNIPDSCSALLEHYCTADLLEQAKEVHKASTYWQDFQKLFIESKRKIKQLAEADKMRVMAPFNSMPLFAK